MTDINYKYKLDKPCTAEDKLEFFRKINYEHLALTETGTAYLAVEIPEPTEEELKAEEENYINNLTMTALDLITLVQKAGVSPETIKTYLDNNAQMYLMLFGCKDVFCGVVRKLCPLTIGDVTLTDDMVVNAFRKKNGEDVELPAIEEVSQDPTPSPSPVGEGNE